MIPASPPVHHPWPAAILAQAGPTGALTLAYAAFVGLVLAMLALDLGVFHRRPHAFSMREAGAWTAVWIGVAMLFNAAVYLLYDHHVLGLGVDVPVLGSPGVTQTLSGAEAARTFFAAYVVEKSLSMDNVFVIAIIFTSLAIPPALQHRVLFWGILGALAMRGAMIAVGATLVANFAWTTYVFGGLLVLTATKMALVRDEGVDPSTHIAVRLLKRVIPVSEQIDGQRFFSRIDGRLAATPLLVALLLIEVSDALFAVDSVPAVFAITADPFIVFTSNILAILGLRSLYFCLAAMIDRFRHLKRALVVMLLFVGVKMCLVHTPLKIPTDASILVILVILAAGVLTSLLPAESGRDA